MIAHPIGYPIPDPIGNLIARTYERTDGEDTCVNLTGSTKPTRTKNADSQRVELTPWGDLTREWRGADTRWPVLRTGQRQPIRWAKRVAILARDAFTCRVCGITKDQEDFEIDHIIPWSAMGSDHSSNLRALCKPCNQRRGNANDMAEHRLVLPVTLWCRVCYGYESPRCALSWTEHATHKRKLCPSNDPRFAVEHMIPDDAGTFAFCGHCGTQGYTDVTL